MQKQNETVVDIMAELAGYCADVRSRKISKESSFFASLGEATRLQEACLYGDIEDVLRQLRAIRGEDNALAYVVRIEAALKRGSTSVEGVKSENAEPSAIEVGGYNDDGSDDNGNTDGSEDCDGATGTQELQVPTPKHPAKIPAVPAQKKKSPPKPSGKPRKLKQSNGKTVPPAKTSTPSHTVAPRDTTPSTETGTKCLTEVIPEIQERNDGLKMEYPVSANHIDANLAAAESRLSVILGNIRRNYLETAKCLGEIKDKELYLELHPSFKEYCENRLPFSYRRAMQFIDSISTIEKLELEMANPGSLSRLPENEAQIRELAVLEHPQHMSRAWKEALAATPEGKTPSRKIVQAAVRSVKGEKAKVSPTVVDEKGDDGNEPEDAGNNIPSAGTITGDSSDNGTSESTLDSETIPYQIDQAEKTVKKFFALLGSATVSMDNYTLAIDISTCDMAMECLIRAELEARLARGKHVTSCTAWL